jgi:hypothetical protein
VFRPGSELIGAGWIHERREIVDAPGHQREERHRPHAEADDEDGKREDGREIARRHPR